jgi:hypothetical protein
LRCRERQHQIVVPLAPRYDIRLVDAVRLLDDRRQPIAETCRQVAAVAERLGLPRPSYVHLRRVVHRERETVEGELRERAARREVRDAALTALLTGRIPDPYYLADRLDAARRR